MTDLDTEMLAVYCAMLSRFDAMNGLCRALLDDMNGLGLTARLEAMGELDALNGKLQSMERNLLQYAEKLGLTPAGRMRLARTRAEVASAPDDLFGD